MGQRVGQMTNDLRDKFENRGWSDHVEESCSMENRAEAAHLSRCLLLIEGEGY